MDAKNIVVSVVSIAIACLFAVTLLIPVISESTAETDTFKNEGYFDLNKFTDSYVLTWDASSPTIFNVNGEDVTYNNTSGLTVSIVLGKDFALRLLNNNTGVNFYGKGTFISANTDNPTLSLTYENGKVTATNTVTSKEITDQSEVFGIVDDGSYVMKKSESPAYLNSGSEVIADSEIYASGQTYNGGAYIFWHMEGTIDDMEYPDTFNASISITDETINGSYDTTHDDLYILQNITFKATSNNLDYNVTASYFVVPSEVTAERTIHPDESTTALLNIIPLFVVMGIILGAVGLIAYRRL